MNVGCIRRSKKPGHIAKTLAIVSKYYDVELVYINPEDIEIGNDKVEGRILIKDKWTRKEVEIPRFIDVKSTLFSYKKHRKKLRYLNKKSTLSVNKRLPLPKDRLYDSFGNDSDISQYLIPTRTVEDTNDIFQMIKSHRKVVIKPVRSNGGRNVIIMNKKGTKYVLGIGKELMTMSARKFKKYYKEKYNSADVIVQKYIESADSHGNPIDCRIHVEKDINGKWNNVDNFVRIGVGQKVVSNISQGGGVADAKKYLKYKYKENWRNIYKEIQEIAEKLPYKVEELLGRKYMTLGFDIGMDREGNLYLFEINDCPIVSPIISKVALSRAGYYRYMLDNL